jgi:peptide/nickel transport system permease protein
VASNTAATALAPEADEVLRPRRPWTRSVWMIIRQNPLGFAGLVVIVALGMVALFAPLIAPYEVGDFRGGTPRENPSWSHLFGTDHLGRDMFSRVVFGARISMTVAFFSVILGTGVALALGIISGYLGGVVDNAIQRTVDTVIAFPQLLLLLILAQVMGPSMETVIFAVGLGVIAPVARVVRGAVLSERNNQYVEAARALGASTFRILFLHIAPNMVALAIIIASTLFGVAILAEASLSFLGLGIPVPNPSWGTDVNLARSNPPLHVWWALFPGAAITLTVLGFNLLGDGLRDVLDPRLKV